MEKYGVEEKDTDEAKTAEEKITTCPDCGGELYDPEETGGLLICQMCGTKPFEKRQ